MHVGFIRLHVNVAIVYFKAHLAFMKVCKMSWERICRKNKKEADLENELENEREHRAEPLRSGQEMSTTLRVSGRVKLLTHNNPNNLK